MNDRPTIGDILMGSGRVSSEDVAEALEYQRRHGGYFGQALVACGFVSEEEVEWGLASQFDLPYVFPEADAVDYRAASLVSPEWALAHLTLPIMRTDDSLRVIIDSPLKTQPVEELRDRTQLDIELARASLRRLGARDDRVGLVGRRGDGPSPTARGGLACPAPTRPRSALGSRREWLDAVSVDGAARSRGPEHAGAGRLPRRRIGV